MEKVRTMLDLEWKRPPSMNRTPAEDVRCRCKSGKLLLVLSFSHFDPEQTSRCFGLGEKIKISARQHRAQTTVFFERPNRRWKL
jgi:hypothetical protein